MFYRPNNMIPDRIKSNPNDIASTLFVADTLHSEHYKNPIIPIPVRVDKVSNGEYTHIVLPSVQPYVEQDDKMFFIDIVRFIELGLQNLMSYSAIKFQQITYRPLNIANISKWWENTRTYTCNIPTYTKDMDLISQSYLEAYVRWLSSKDITGELLSYCDSVIDLCNERLSKNYISFQSGRKLISNHIFTERKDGKKLPQIWEVDRIATVSGKVRKRAFLPLLIYDDLLECFLSNRAELERGELEVISFTELEHLNIFGITPLGVKDPLKEIHLSSSRFDKVLVDR